MIDLADPVDFDIDLQGLTFQGLYYNTDELLADTDYTYDDINHTLTLTNTFLIHIYDMVHTSYTLTLKTNEGPATDFNVVFDHPLNRVVNGGFETGDLYGWTPYQIWKDESGLSAFRNSRVVSTPYYGSTDTDPYNKEGTYLFGLYAYPYDNTNKDLNQERTGMLRSTDFVVDGSGFISFRLGGGENTGTAYVSIHDSVTHEELARFANRHFRDTDLSGTTNAEGYMFQYYADLSSFIGRSVYILIVDAASHEWSVLSFDSFVTYYASTPAYTADELAEDIVPVISDRGLGLTYIDNGDLTANLDKWENPNGVFTIANGGAISSVGGNSAVGVLRSPAFKISGTECYLDFQFAGAIQYDKQVFILVKEVGTNLEVLRLTRRDNLSTRADSGNFDHHWYDLSGLDPNKEYYLEVVDNRDGDWGVALVKEFFLTNTTPAVATDVAVNAFYGLAQVSPVDGGSRVLVSEITSADFTTVSNLTMSLGENPLETLRMSYHALNEVTLLEYTLAEDIGFQNSTYLAIQGVPFGTPVSNLYGFSDRYVFQPVLEGLTPGTDYIFRIHDGFHTTGIHHFKTATPNSSFRFLYLTDTQAKSFDNAMISKTLIENAYTYYDDYRFLMHTGDIVENGSSWYDWDLFFQAGLADLPTLSVVGNHDYMDPSSQIDSSDNYNAFFNNPKNGSSSYLNTSYYVLYDNVLFIMLDVVTGNDLTLQQAWFLNVVDSHPADVVIVGCHYSPYGTYHETNAVEMVTDWVPIFDQAGVDLVISGHDHIYARTPALIDSTTAADPNTGTVYFIGGTGGYKYRYVADNEGDVFDYYLIDTTSSISIITVSDTEITVLAIDVDGGIFDLLNIPS